MTTQKNSQRFGEYDTRAQFIIYGQLVKTVRVHFKVSEYNNNK